jgi:hypothetical protein
VATAAGRADSGHRPAGLLPVNYSNVAVELLADNAAPEAEAVYAALGMPFSGLVFGLKQYFQGDDSRRR